MKLLNSAIGAQVEGLLGQTAKLALQVRNAFKKTNQTTPANQPANHRLLLVTAWSK